MPDANVRLVKEIYARFSRSGDVTDIFDLLHSDIIWLDQVAGLGELVGHEGFVRSLAAMAEQGYELEADPEHFEALDAETVAATGYMRLKSGTSYTDLPAVWLYKIRDGCVVAGASSTRRDEAFEALEDVWAKRAAGG